MADAYEIPGKRYTYLSTGDLSSKLFHAVKQSGTGKRIVACGSGTSSAGDQMLGILQNKPKATDDASTVMVDGVSKAVAGAAITVGARLKTDANGRFIPVASGTDIAVGTAETAAAANGELFSIRFGIA